MLQALEKDGPESSHIQSASFEQGVCWELPMRGWMVFNIDGAAKGNLGPAGAGGVLRNDKGEWMIGFFEYLDHCSAMIAEFKALAQNCKGDGSSKIGAQNRLECAGGHID